MTQQGHTGGSPAVPTGVALASSHTAAAGPPSDQVVANPVDGAIHIDTAGSKIWVRIGGTWKSVGVS